MVLCCFALGNFTAIPLLQTVLLLTIGKLVPHFLILKLLTGGLPLSVCWLFLQVPPFLMFQTTLYGKDAHSHILYTTLVVLNKMHCCFWRDTRGHSYILFDRSLCKTCACLELCCLQFLSLHDIVIIAIGFCVVLPCVAIVGIYSCTKTCVVCSHC